MQQGGCGRAVLLLLLVAAAAAPCAGQLAVGSVCSSRTAAACTADVPIGYTIVTCEGGVECGISLNSSREAVCSVTQQRALAAMLASARPLCNCTARLADYTSRAPSLFQAGTTQTVNPFRGATSAVLTGVVEAVACVARQSSAAVREVNKAQLLDELYAEKAVKVLAGVSDMALTMLPRLDVAGHLRMMQAVQQCAAAAASAEGEAPGATNQEAAASSGDPAPAQAPGRGVPAGCSLFVDWFGSYAGPSLRIVVGSVQAVYDAYAEYLGEVLYNMETLLPAVSAMVKPDAWAAYVAAAVHTANASGCADPAACFSGLLAEPWALLAAMPGGLGSGRHPALDSLGRLAAAAHTSADAMRNQSCAAGRLLSNAAVRRVAIYRALQAELAAAGVDASSPEAELFALGPKLLADVAVQLSGLASLQQSLQQPASVLRDLAVAAQADVSDAADSYQARLRAALKRLSRAQDRILVMLPNSNAGGSMRVCEDGGTPMACPIDGCAAAGTPAATMTETGGVDGGNATSTGRASCPRNMRCIMDGCARCEPLCLPPLAFADATAALEVLKAWTAALRSNTQLMEGDVPVHEIMPRLAASLAYVQNMVSSSTSGAVRAFAYRAGLLTYQRHARLSGTVPCPRSMVKRCFTYKKWTACGNTPKIGNCRVNEVFPLPNEHLPYLAVHPGLYDVMMKAMDSVMIYYHPPTPVPPCA